MAIIESIISFILTLDFIKKGRCWVDQTGVHTSWGEWKRWFTYPWINWSNLSIPFENIKYAKVSDIDLMKLHFFIKAMQIFSFSSRVTIRRERRMVEIHLKSSQKIVGAMGMKSHLLFEVPDPELLVSSINYNLNHSY